MKKPIIAPPPLGANSTTGVAFADIEGYGNGAAAALGIGCAGSCIASGPFNISKHL